MGSDFLVVKTLKPESLHTQPLTPNSLHLNQVRPPEHANVCQLWNCQPQFEATRARKAGLILGTILQLKEGGILETITGNA